jgi:5-methyltetrahydrofolate--homocysteine methyltransferase
MVASSNSITDYVPPDNMKALIQATFEFGRYPIELEEGGVKGNIWKYQGKAKKEAATVKSELDIEAYMDGLLSNDVSRVTGLVHTDIDSGREITEVINRGLIPAMTEVGKKFQKGIIYIPEMMIAARMMEGTIDSLKDLLAGKADKKLGKVVVGTVKGDLHDIGKNLVKMMLEGQGFAVEDMGVSVSPEKFVRNIKENNTDIVAMSALLTTTMIEMKNTINALRDAGVRDRVKVIVGGAPVTQKFAEDIGADGYAYDAPGAAQLCKKLLSY